MVLSVDKIYMLIVILILVVILGSVFVTLYPVMQDINSMIQENPDLSNQSKEVSGQITNSYPSLLDYVSVLLVFIVILGAGTIIWFSENHVLSFLVLLFIFGFLIVSGSFMTNYFSDLLTDSGASNSFPITTWIVNHYMLVIMASFFMSLSMLGVKLYYA